MKVARPHGQVQGVSRKHRKAEATHHISEASEPSDQVGWEPVSSFA